MNLFWLSCVLNIVLCYNMTRLGEMITEKETAAKLLCRRLNDYYENPKSDCNRVDSCDPNWYRDILADGGTVQCVSDFGFDEYCSCTQSSLSYTHSTVKYAPTLTSPQRYDDEVAKKFACSSYHLTETNNAIRSSDPNVKWQYISSPTGLITIYPGTIHAFVNRTTQCKHKRWGCKEFDPRERPWYISAASGPKDVVLVLDRSASMLHGGDPSRLDIMKDVSSVVIGGMGPNDRASVVLFSSEAITCSESLLPMNSSSKQILETCVSEITPDQGTNTYDGFKKAFDILESRDVKPWICHTAILFITDGVSTSGKSDEALLKYISERNNHDIRAQIFTFTVGSDADVALSQSLSCQSRGVWTPIRDGHEGDFRSEMVGYYNYFVYSNRTRGAIWTGEYEDILGLGKMTTATIGCFSDDNSLLGVAGIDIMTSEFVDQGFPFAEVVYPYMFERGKKCYDLEMSDQQLDQLRKYHKCSPPENPPDPRPSPNFVLPSWAIYSSGFTLLFLLTLCCGCCILCCVGLVFCCYFFCCFCVCCSVVCCQFVVVSKQKKSLWKFRRIDDSIMDQFLQEQSANAMLDESEIASLRINKNLFEIDYKDLTIHKKIGGGGSQACGVYLVSWEGKQCAFKIFRISDLCSQQDFEEFEREVEIFSSIHHPNITSFYGATLRNPRVGIVMEYCELGDLKGFLKRFRKEKSSRFPVRTKLEMLQGISSAMKYLHKINIIHRDLKCENCLVTKHYDTKLVDFGLSKLVSDKLSNGQMTQRIGTTLYMAPEVVKGQDYSNKVDVFPFGIMMYEVISENWNPYGNVPLINLEFKVAINPNFRPVLSESVVKTFDSCKWAIDLMKRCWDDNPSVRPDFSEVFRAFEDHHMKVKETGKKRKQFEDDSLNDVEEEEEELGETRYSSHNSSSFRMTEEQFLEKKKNMLLKKNEGVIYTINDNNKESQKEEVYQILIDKI